MLALGTTRDSFGSNKGAKPGGAKPKGTMPGGAQHGGSQHGGAQLRDGVEFSESLLFLHILCCPQEYIVVHNCRQQRNMA